jgi:transcription initiation factor IIE alpha subunit
MRFVGAVYCPRVEKRVKLGDDYRYGQEFVCPGCGVRVEATDHSKKNPPRRNVQITTERPVVSA